MAQVVPVAAAVLGAGVAAGRTAAGADGAKAPLLTGALAARATEKPPKASAARRMLTTVSLILLNMVTFLLGLSVRSTDRNDSIVAGRCSGQSAGV